MKYYYRNNSLIIELDRAEASQCGFGFESIESVVTHLNDMVCDNCNMDVDEEEIMYYVCRLRGLYCQECFEDMIDNIDGNKSFREMVLEVKAFNNVMRKLYMDITAKVDKVDNKTRRIVINDKNKTYDNLSDEEMKEIYEDMQADNYLMSPENYERDIY